MDLELKKKIKDGIIKEQTREQQENGASLFIQTRIKGILARKQIEVMRQEEMFFLGMARRPKTVQEKMRDPIQKMKTIQEERRQTRMKFMDDFKTAREVRKGDILEDEGDDIMEQMKKERRDWIQDYK